ncbi:MAG TPA: pitrilysin family protein [Ramlibacter sp.]|jgi:zinc protease
MQQARHFVRWAQFAALACVLAQPAWAALPIQQWKQPSGAQVWLVESHSLPMVDVQIDVDAGGRRDPAEKAGLASVTAAMTSKGIAAREGQPALDENQLGEAWADLGAGFGASAGSDRMSFSLRSLTYPELLAKAVALGARQIGEPSFPDHVWQRDRQRMSASIREANTRPATIANRTFYSAVYGSHPYGYDTTEESLARIAVQDMRSHYALVQPCRAKVSIVGAVNRAQADQIASALLARLPAGNCTALPPVPEVATLAAPVERAVPFTSAQAHVLIGQPGYRRDDPDYFPLLVGNYTLGGGGFVSRLTTEVREKRGLSYSIYSYFAPGMHAGAFTLGLQTRPDQAAQAVEVSRDVLRRFVAEGPTEAELKAAKDFLVGGFALRIDSNRKLLDNLAAIAWHDLPLDYLDTWTRQVERVTAAEIKAAFARKLQPDRMVTVVLGGVAPTRQ